MTCQWLRTDALDHLMGDGVHGFGLAQFSFVGTDEIALVKKQKSSKQFDASKATSFGTSTFPRVAAAWIVNCIDPELWWRVTSLESQSL